MTKFAFDACIPIGLHAIKYLSDVLQKLKELSDRVYMDHENVSELVRESGAGEKSALSSSGIFHDERADDRDFEGFRRWLADHKIVLKDKDTHVLYVAYKKKTDYTVSSDGTVLKQADRMRVEFGIEYMKPMTNVGLINYLYANGKISYKEYLEVTLKYFKYVEMENIYNHLTVADKELRWDVRVIKERFQVYKNPLLEALKGKRDEQQKKVDMAYG
jgi:hypothetical protein